MSVIAATAPLTLKRVPGTTQNKALGGLVHKCVFLGDWWAEAELRALLRALEGLGNGRFDAVTEVG